MDLDVWTAFNGNVCWRSFARRYLGFIYKDHQQQETYRWEINLMSNLHDTQDRLSSYYGVRLEIISQQEIGFTCILFSKPERRKDFHI